MIDVREGQFCVVQKSGSYRVIRADKVTAKQIRTYHFADMYDVENRDNILFAGTEEEANAVQQNASAVRWSVEAEIEEARLRYHSAIEPFAERFAAERAEAQKKGQRTLLAIFAPASVDRSPEGGDHEDGRHAKHESAVGEAETPK